MAKADHPDCKPGSFGSEWVQFPPLPPYKGL